MNKKRKVKIIVSLVLLFLFVGVVGTTSYLTVRRQQVATGAKAAGVGISDAPVTRKVFVLDFSPILENKPGSPKVWQHYSGAGWSDPAIMNAAIPPIFPLASGGYLNYSIIGTQVIDGYPRKTDGYVFTDSAYLTCVDSNGSNCPSHAMADMPGLYADYALCSKGADEIWIWGGPYFGFLEHEPRSDCGKTMWMMGFSYERDLAEATHNFGHRMEVVGNVRVGDGSWAWSDRNTWNEANEFNKFVYDKHCGWMHYVPGAIANNVPEYVTTNTENFVSDCDGYLNYPTGPFTGLTQNCNVWGCNPLGYNKWWLGHIPHKTGTKVTQEGGSIYNNWWKYYAFWDPVAGTYSNIADSLADNAPAVFSFDYSGIGWSFMVDMSESADFSWGVYLDFAKGRASAGGSQSYTVQSPKAKWGGFTCGKPLYWRVRTPQSPGFPEVVSPGKKVVIGGVCPLANNVAPLATALASSEFDVYYPASNVADNIVGQPGDGEWASAGEQNPWIKLTWPTSVTIGSVALFDRATPESVNGGTLSFSDGSSLVVTGIPSDGTTAKMVEFANKTVTWVKFQVSGGVGANVGLSEMRVFRGAVVTSTPTNTPTPTPTPTSPVSPAFNSNIDNVRPVFDWQDSAGATSYNFQVSTVNTFATLVLNLVVPGSTYIPATNLPASKQLFWRVKTNGPSGASPWSTTSIFTTGNPPTIPTLSLPANGSISLTTSPLLKWTAPTVAPLASRYQVQISTASTFVTTVLDNTNVTTNSLTVSPALTSGLMYYWRVRSYGANNHYSAWSPVWSFKTTLNPPTLSSPTNGAINVMTTRPTFDWSDVTGATGYTLQISTVSTFATIAHTGTITTATSTYTPAVDLTKGILLYWRVRGNQGALLGTFSTPFSFTSANPPTTPVLSAPVTNSISLTTSPLLKWTAPTVAPLASRYQVQISTASTFVTTVLDNTNVTTNSLTVTPALSPNTTYYWRVRSYGANNHYSAWSTTFVLKISLAAPALSLPINNATDVVTTRPTFDWSDVTGATGYTLQISTVSTFATIAHTGTITTATSTYTPAVDLTKNLRLYWRVKANGGLGASDFSSVFSFTSANPPVVPVLVSPANNTGLASYPPLLNWNDSLGLPSAARYEVQVAKDSLFLTGIGSEFVDGVSQLSPNYVFTPGVSYYWRVRAYTSAGHYSNWSGAFRFNIPPSAPFGASR